MVGVIGGLFVGGLLAGALLGVVPGAILIGLGTAVSCWELYREKRAEAEAESWRRSYPSYKY